MPLITAIEKQKRRQRADISLDGVVAFSLRLDVVVMGRLAVGQELDTQQRRAIEAEDQRLGAVEYALRLFAMGQRTEKDLRDRLKRRGFRTEATENAVTRMREMGYINDAAYARGFVQTRLASAPRSRRALAFELGMKGVDRELVDEAVSEISDVEAALQAAERRMRSLRNLDRLTFTKKMSTFLASRGFSYGVARTAIDRCWRRIESDDEDGTELFDDYET